MNSRSSTSFRIVSQGVGAFHVVEDGNYALHLARTGDKNDRGEQLPPIPYSLWLVTIEDSRPAGQDPIRHFPIMHYLRVLAEDEERAIGQARCALELESYILPDGDERYISCSAEPEDLIIQAWSRNRFGLVKDRAPQEHVHNSEVTDLEFHKALPHHA